MVHSPFLFCAPSRVRFEAHDLGVRAFFGLGIFESSPVDMYHSLGSYLFYSNSFILFLISCMLWTWFCIGLYLSNYYILFVCMFEMASSPSGVGQHVPTLIFGDIGVGACQFGIKAWLFRAYLGYSSYSSSVSALISFGCHWLPCVVVIRHGCAILILHVNSHILFEEV